MIMGSPFESRLFIMGLPCRDTSSFNSSSSPSETTCWRIDSGPNLTVFFFDTLSFGSVIKGGRDGLIMVSSLLFDGVEGR